MTLLQHISNFVAAQEQLLRAFHGQVSFQFPSLADVPRNGRVYIQNQAWSWSRHGAGICFSSESGACIIDAHIRLDLPHCFDLWRLETYLESIGDQRHPLELEASLKRLLASNLISSCAEEPLLYTLNAKSS